MNRTFEITVDVVTVKRNANGKAVGQNIELNGLTLVAHTLEELREKKALLDRMAAGVGMTVNGFLAREIITETAAI